MQDTKTTPEAWEDLFEQFHQKTDQFTGQIDRLHDDLQHAWKNLDGYEGVLEEIRATAGEITRQAKEVEAAWRNAEELGRIAGAAAGKSLTESSSQAVQKMTQQINGATQAAHEASKKLSKATAWAGGWIVFCIATTLTFSGLAASGTYYVMRQTSTTERDHTRQMEGDMLERMYQSANSHERKLLDSLIQRLLKANT